jgi:DNA-binding transcriptional ArsR family regulator
MARAPTTSDAFNAIAEPQRRRILTLLKGAELAAGDVADQLGLNQSATSKHLGVLREVGLVHVRREGKRRVYRLDARGLEPIHEWIGGFEEFWNETFGRLDEYVQELQRTERSSAN